MNDITIYLDMDGVLADFNKAYRELDPKREDRKKFREAVIHYKIFETLDLMPGATELLKYVASIPNVNVEILTSKGTHDPFQGHHAEVQKKVWLAKHHIKYKPNFTCDKEGKALYATPNSILIDDSAGCINPFVIAGGHGILHTNAEDTIKKLGSLILQLRALNSLRS